MDRTKLEPEMVVLLKRLRRFAVALCVVAATSGTFLVLTPRPVLLSLPRWLVAGIATLLALSAFLLFCFPILYSNYKQLASARGQLRDQLSARRRRHP